MTDFISGLPVEITNHIIALLDSKKPMCEISLCSKLLQCITLQHLYRHVELYDISDHQYFPKSTFLHLRDLTVLFLRKPEYVSLVRHLTVRNCSKNLSDEDGWDSYSNSECEPIETVEDRQLLKRAILTLSYSKIERKEWFDAVNSWKHHQDALLAIMLPVLVRLEKLDLMILDNLRYFERIFARISSKKKPFDTRPALTALKDVVHMGYHNKRVYGHRVATYGPKSVIERGLATFQLGDSNPTHLELKECRLHFADLCAILHANKNLQTFIYEYDGHHIYSRLNMPHLQAALDTMQRTLKNLWLDCVGCSNFIIDNTTNIIRAMDFTSFTSLRFLHLASVFIYGSSWANGPEKDQMRPLSSALPSQLLRLQITHSRRGNKVKSTKNLLNDLKDFLQKKSQCVKFVDLKRLVLESNVFHPYYLFKFGDLLATILVTPESLDLEIMLIDSDTEYEDKSTFDIFNIFEHDPEYEELKSSASRKIMWEAGVNRFNHVRTKKMINTQELREVFCSPGTEPSSPSTASSSS